MWLRRDDTQDELARASRDAIGAVWTPDHLRGAVEGTLVSSAAWQAASELGWFDLLRPESHGGLGLGVIEAGVIFEEAGRLLFPGPLFGSAVIAPLLAADGHEAGDGITAVALAGTTAPQASMIRLADGHVSGTCPLVEAPDEANTLLLQCTLDEEPALAAVAPGSAGVALSPLPTIDKILGLTRVELDQAAASTVVAGPEAAAWIERIETLAHTMYATRMLGTAEQLLALAHEYALTRHQFGRPIGSFQALQHLLADMQVAVSTGRAVCHVAQAAIASQHADASHRARVAKAYLSLVGRNVAESALQVLGGIGFTTEHDLHLYYKHVLTLQALWGDERHHQDVLGAEVVARVSGERAHDRVAAT
jgi:alkylation response protein AidB-like acyl-CoA dehydrogenase